MLHRSITHSSRLCKTVRGGERESNILMGKQVFAPQRSISKTVSITAWPKRECTHWC